jgi:hypothetical protein
MCCVLYWRHGGQALLALDVVFRGRGFTGSRVHVRRSGVLLGFFQAACATDRLRCRDVRGETQASSGT